MSCEIIVEIGNSHEGSVGIAKSFIDMVSLTGAKTVKFQMHLPDFESTKGEPFRVKFSDQDKNRFDYWKRTGFSTEEWLSIIKYTNEMGLEFMCTPFSIEAARWLFDNGAIKRWKVGSGDAANLPLLDYLVSTNLPIIISTGLISLSELEQLEIRFKHNKALDRVIFLHCISEYPTLTERIGFNIFNDLQIRFGRAGYSDHSGNLFNGIYAISRGAKVLEVHMVPHKQFFGPDTTSSLLPSEIKTLCEYSSHIEILENSTLSKDSMYTNSLEIRTMFRKGIYWSRNKQKGDKVLLSDLVFRKPVVNLDAFEFEKVLGKILNSSVKELSPVSLDDLGLE